MFKTFFEKIKMLFTGWGSSIAELKQEEDREREKISIKNRTLNSYQDHE